MQARRKLSSSARCSLLAAMSLLDVGFSKPVLLPASKDQAAACCAGNAQGWWPALPKACCETSRRAGRRVAKTVVGTSHRINARLPGCKGH